MKDIRNRVIIGALLGVAVLIGLLLYSDVREMGAHLRAFPLGYIPPVLALTLFNYLLRWIKWHYYLRLIGAGAMRPVDSAALWVSGFVLALSPGKVAELLKAVVLRVMIGVPVARGAPVVVAERITDGLAMLVLAALGFGGMVSISAAHRAVLARYLPAAFTVFALLLAGIIAIQIRPLFRWLLGTAARLPLLGRISHTLDDLYTSSYTLLRPSALTLAVGLGVVSWAGECAGFFLILVGMGLEPTWLLFWQAMFMLALASVIGAVSGLPGGLGAAEFSLAGMIQLLVLGHEDASFAGTATLLIRLFTLWFAVVLGLIAAFAFRKRLFPPRVAEEWRAASLSTAESRH